MNKLFISQNRGGGVDPIITFTFGGNSYYSEGESKLVYYDYNNNEHVLKTWNKAYIIDFTVNIPKNIITSTWGLQLQLNNANYWEDYKKFVQKTTLDGMDISEYSYMQQGNVHDEPNIIAFTTLCDVAPIKKSLVINVSELPINVFYLSYNTYNKNTSGINFNINSRYTVETDTTCAVHYNPGGSNLTTKTMTSRTQVVSNITTALFGSFPLYVTLNPKETSSRLNRHNIYSGYITMNFSDCHLYNATSDEFVDWSEVKSNLWGRDIKNAPYLTLSTPDRDINTAFTMITADNQSLMFFIDPAVYTQINSTTAVTFVDKTQGYRLQCNLDGSYWIPELKTNGVFLGFNSGNSLVEMPFRGLYKI